MRRAAVLLALFLLCGLAFGQTGWTVLTWGDADCPTIGATCEAGPVLFCIPSSRIFYCGDSDSDGTPDQVAQITFLAGNDKVSLRPDEDADGTGTIEVYGPFTNKATASTEFQFDANGDDLWDVELSDDGTDSGLVLRNGLPFIQFGVGAKLKIKLCGGSLDAGFFYDEDDDGTFDATDDFCWGLGGYDYDCNCVADSGSGSGDMTKAVYDTDADSTVDKADALAANGANCSAGQAPLGVDTAGAVEGCWTPTGSSPAGFALDSTSNWYTFNADEDGSNDVALFDPRLVDSNGDGTLDLDITAGGLGGLHGDATYAQRFAIFPGGYSTDPFDYTIGYVLEADAANTTGAFYPVVSDPNNGSLTNPPYVDIGTSTHKWRNGYFGTNLYVSTATFNGIGYSNTYEGASNFWNSYAGQSWKTDSDYDDANTRKYDWQWQTGVSTTVTAMHLDGDATPQAWIDVNGDGSYDIQFDSTMTDCDNGTTSKVLWSIETGKLSCGTDQTSAGGGDDLNVDGTATASSSPNLDDGGDINFAYAAPNITATVKADSVALGTDTTGNYAGSGSEGGAATTASALAANGANCSAGQYPLGVDAAGAVESCTAVPVVYALTAWHRENIGASGTAYLSPVDAATNLYYSTPIAFTLSSLSCVNSAVITAGTITYTVLNNAGSSSDLTVQQTTGTADGAVLTDTACTSNCSISAGQKFRIQAVSAGTVAPTTTDPNCTLVVTIP